MESQKHIKKKKVILVISGKSHYVYGKSVESTEKVFAAFFPLLILFYSK